MLSNRTSVVPEEPLAGGAVRKPKSSSAAPPALRRLRQNRRRLMARWIARIVRMDADQRREILTALRMQLDPAAEMTRPALLPAAEMTRVNRPPEEMTRGLAHGGNAAIRGESAAISPIHSAELGWTEERNRIQRVLARWGQ